VVWPNIKAAQCQKQCLNITSWTNNSNCKPPFLSLDLRRAKMIIHSKGMT
jgi:hypothetical protein